MSAKVHLHMHVSDLAKSREFYERFLGADPVKVKAGYVKFLPEWAPVNLALSEGGHAGEGTVNHVGVQVDAVDTVMAAARPRQGGRAARARGDGRRTAATPTRTSSGSRIPTASSGRCTTSTTTSRTRTRPRPAWGFPLAKGDACCAS